MKKIKKQAQSLIEYGLILALVAVVAVTILGKFSTSINNVGEQANTAVSSAGTNALEGYCTSIGSTYDATSGQCQ
jgi:Flp pilus assembly pilin Flp